MKKLLLLVTILSSSFLIADSSDNVQFTPPSGWHFAETQNKLKSVRTMVVGEGKHVLRPSISLGTESFPGTLREYVKVVKSLSATHGGDCKDLGTINTEAGNAALLQEDTKTVWGDLRMMHVILLKNGMIYILTAGALKEEFPKFYPDFFRAMRSLRIGNDMEMAG